MTRHAYIIGFAFLTIGFLAPQWLTNSLAAAEQIGPQPALSPPIDTGGKASAAADPSKKKAVLEAVLSPESEMQASAMESAGSDKRERHPGYRPLCGPSPDAINHYACAPGYDSW